ncbi:MAG TPA: 2-oxo acid dehydrogenase subunit E2, partial [Streptosporangiaceae bacterium]|nr:2-oxo acid dehydrogenase subunit E2 [Streptosporangiaceae bacterium]
MVEELYQRYLADPGSVDRAWWSFFADYQPTLPNGTGLQPVLSLQPAPPAPVPPPAAAPPAPPVQQAAPVAPARPAPPSPVAPPPPVEGAEVSRLRGAAARTVSNMTASLAVPTATSVRAVPAKLLVDNRIVINNHLRRGRGGKVSFTHLIGYAVVKALVALPEMNLAYTEENGKPAIARPDHVNLGLAVDVHTSDGGRQLLVPNIKTAEEMDFRKFWTSYEDTVRRARAGKLAVADFQGTTATITNPGTIGTEHSVPRLMAGQGCIVGVGAMEYP